MIRWLSIVVVVYMLAALTWWTLLLHRGQTALLNAREKILQLQYNRVYGVEDFDITQLSELQDIQAERTSFQFMINGEALVFAIEQEANQIAVSTRRGKGNWVIVSHGVAAALNSAGVMDTGLGLSGPQGFDSDVAGSLFAGTLNGRMKVYIDPYASVDYFTVGYKGSNPYDAGMFYCPYVPLSMMKTIGENDFQPRIGFKTRYGIADNPFVTAGNSNNVYYRKRKILAL